MLPTHEIPATTFTPKCHPLANEVSAEVDTYFLAHWSFSSKKAEQKFVKAGFSRVTCLYFPEALDDRIHFACRLLTLLFLIDDVLDDMSFEEGSDYNERLIVVSRGDLLPDRSIPVERITYDLWESMRHHDKELADEILEPVFQFMRAQTDKKRASISDLGAYFEYRIKDVGKALLSALMRFTMRLKLTEEETAAIEALEHHAAKHISVVNDICSYEKEVMTAQTGHREGGALCSSVSILSKACDVSTPSAKRVLWFLTRDWEHAYVQLVEKILGPWPKLETYTKGLEYQMSGNELWSKTTKRYQVVNGA